MNVNTRFINELRAAKIEVHDVRNQMPRNGNYAWKGDTWAYNTVHYTAAWRERGTYQQELNSWLGHGRFHVNTRGWPGIAYNIGISPSGRVFLMKDIERWGYHAFNTNAISMAVSNDTTLGQEPTPQMMRSLQVVLLVLESIMPNLSRKNVYTHNQMRWNDRRNGDTNCAGPKIDAATAIHRSGRNFVEVDAVVPETEMKPDHAHIKQTDKWVVGNIFKMWSSIGGNVLVFGYPLTGMSGNEEDGYVQYFERAVFHHTPKGPKYPDQFDVHLQRIGVEVAREKYEGTHLAFAPVKKPKTENPNVTYFPATRHTIANGFKGYWEKYGGLRLFGYPISEEFVEDDKVVQYFERARFEWAPGTDAKRYDVVLGRLGAEVLAMRAAQEPRPEYNADTPIRGKGTLTAEQIDDAFRSWGKRMAAQYAPDGEYQEPPQVGQVLIDLCIEHDLNWDVVTAQMIHESAAWQSKIARDKNNPAGLGATNDAPYENALAFPTPYGGVEATVAHLMSYVYGDDSPLKSKSVRHEVLRRVGYLGIAKVWRDLNGRWAWPGETYAQSITKIANQIGGTT